MPDLKESKGYIIIKEIMSAQGRQPFLFQEKTWEHIINGESGLVNAPTGCGKTYSVFLGALIDFINHHPDDFKKIKNSGLQLLWITPLRASRNWGNGGVRDREHLFGQRPSPSTAKTWNPHGHELCSRPREHVFVPI